MVVICYGVVNLGGGVEVDKYYIPPGVVEGPEVVGGPVLVDGAGVVGGMVGGVGLVLKKELILNYGTYIL